MLRRTISVKLTVGKIETNFSGYCLYREIDRAVVRIGILMGFPWVWVRYRYGDWNPRAARIKKNDLTLSYAPCRKFLATYATAYICIFILSLEGIYRGLKLLIIASLVQFTQCRLLSLRGLSHLVEVVCAWLIQSQQQSTVYMIHDV